MLYKPNFCCNCGEKVERLEWNLLTSRRFCEACAAENRRHDLLPRISVAAGALALMFGAGAFFGARTDGNVPIQTLSASPALLKADPALGKHQAASRSTGPIQGAVTSEPAAATQQNAEQPAPAKVYYCGALTKKGTPCSRKVKTAGARCYQHERKGMSEPRGEVSPE